MIFGTLEDRDTCLRIEKRVRRCLAYAQTNPLEQFQDGSYSLKEGVKLNINAYVTEPEENRVWEAHREYIDVQVILEGEERADTGLTEEMEQVEGKPEKDLFLLKGEGRLSVILKKGDFIVCYPADAHRTGIILQDACKVRKAVFKVPVDDGAAL